MRFADIDLAKLPAADVIDPLDYEALVAQLKARLVELAAAVDLDLTEVMGLESEPLVKLIETFAYRELIIRARVNDAAKAVMPAYALGRDLEHLAARNGVERLVLVEADPNAVPPVDAVVEKDDRLRDRMQLALEAFSTAGPVGAYLFHALSTPGVRDVGIYGPDSGLVQPAEVLVVVLGFEGNGAASDELLGSVEVAISADDKRPLADRVMVESAEIIEYQVELDVKVLPGPDLALVRSQIEAVVNDYVEAHFRVARAVRRTGLGGAAYIDGVVDDVIITSPAADVIADLRQAPKCTGIEITLTQIPGRWYDDNA